MQEQIKLGRTIEQCKDDCKTARTWTPTTGRGAAGTATRTTARATAAIAASSRATRATPSAARTPRRRAPRTSTSLFLNAATTVEATAKLTSETLASAKSTLVMGAGGRPGPAVPGRNAADSKSQGAKAGTARSSAARTILAMERATRTNVCAAGRRALATHLKMWISSTS